MDLLRLTVNVAMGVRRRRLVGSCQIQKKGEWGISWVGLSGPLSGRSLTWRRERGVARAIKGRPYSIETFNRLFAVEL